MKKLDDFSPLIIINRLSKDSMDIYVDVPSGSVTHNPKLLRLPSRFSQLELITEGFDSIEKNDEGVEFISGNVFLVIDNNDQNKMLLASPKITTVDRKIGFKKQRVSNSQTIKILRKEISDTWQEVFLIALERFNSSSPLTINSDSHAQATPQRKASSRNTPFIFDLNGIFGNFVKLSICFLLLSLLGYLCLNLYGKAMQVQNTRNTNISLNPTALAKNQTDVVDQTFKEMGIDRSKLTSDLSCFAE